MATTPVRLVHHPDGVLELKLDDGSRRNVLGRSTISAIETAVTDPPKGTRVIILTAAAPDFCAGYDLREAAGGDAEALIAHESNFAVLRHSGVPIIAVLQGNVIGGGLELALGADVRIASPEMRMSIPANRLGLVYSLAGVRLLVDELGESMTRSMLLAGRVLGAGDAKSSGLVAEVVDLEVLHERALTLAATMAAWSPEVAAGNRRVLDIAVGRIEDDAAALRRASFRPGGKLEGSISHFASISPTWRERFVTRLRKIARRP